MKRTIWLCLLCLTLAGGPCIDTWVYTWQRLHFLTSFQAWDEGVAWGDVSCRGAHRVMSILEAASLASVAGRTHAWMVAKKTPWIREYLYMSTVRGAWHWQGPRVTYDVGYVIVVGGAWAHLQHGRLIQSLCPPLCCSCCLRQVWRGQELPILYAILLGGLGHGHKQSFGCTHAALFLSCLRTAGSVTIRITTVLIAVFMRKVLVGQTGHSFDDTHVTAAQSYTT